MVDKMSAISKDIEERKSKLKVAQEIKNVLERQRQVSKVTLIVTFKYYVTLFRLLPPGIYHMFKVKPSDQ